MATVLHNSVGLRGTNLRNDTLIVQRNLQLKGFSLGIADGMCGRRTIAAIVSFQSSFLRNPDGLISPSGPTWRRLNGNGAPASPSSPYNPIVPPPSAKPPVPQVKRVDKYTELIVAPPKGTLNIGVAPSSNGLMLRKLGEPRESYSADCQPITNAKLKALLTTESVGPFRVTGLRPAVASLKLVFGDIQAKLPEMYGALGTAGMLCCRFVRGSTSAISNHSWGTAVDLTINGMLDKRGDGKVQVGLTLLAPLFNARGWYWGAGFPTEDGMHFEAGAELVNQFTI